MKEFRMRSFLTTKFQNTLAATIAFCALILSAIAFTCIAFSVWWFSYPTYDAPPIMPVLALIIMIFPLGNLFFMENMIHSFPLAISIVGWLMYCVIVIVGIRRRSLLIFYMLLLLLIFNIMGLLFGSACRVVI
jgi:hypothetical protein